jgi:hypothetical protein
MSEKKIGTTAFSAAISAALMSGCAPSDFHGTSADEYDVVCTVDAPISSHIEDESCVVRGPAGPDSARDTDSMGRGPVASDRTTRTTEIPQPQPPQPAEGSCGSDPSD